VPRTQTEQIYRANVRRFSAHVWSRDDVKTLSTI